MHVVFQFVVLEVKFFFSDSSERSLVPSEAELARDSIEYEVVERAFSSTCDISEYSWLHCNNW